MIWKSLDFHEDGNVNYTEFLAACLSSTVLLNFNSVFFKGIEVEIRF